jgi:NADH:ubiquinone oxidoreductase subunit 5 (subunit L)/multisubunit Na+/H+ antiporter MnhA subunit
MTAFLGFKFLLLIFGNANIKKIEIGTEINRVPWMFQLQLIVLTLVTLFFGTIGVNTFFGDTSSILWGNVIPSPMRLEEGSGNIKKIMSLDVPLIIIFFCGIALAYFLYVFKPELRISLSEKYQTFLPRSYLKKTYGKYYMILTSNIVSYNHLRPYIKFYFVISDLWYGCGLHKILKQIKTLLASIKHNFISYYGVAMLFGMLMFVLYHCYSLKG